MFVSLSYSPSDSKNVKTEQVLPAGYKNDDILKQIPKFAYPCEYKRFVTHSVHTN